MSQHDDDDDDDEEGPGAVMQLLKHQRVFLDTQQGAGFAQMLGRLQRDAVDAAELVMKYQNQMRPPEQRREPLPLWPEYPPFFEDVDGRPFVLFPMERPGDWPARLALIDRAQAVWNKDFPGIPAGFRLVASGHYVPWHLVQSHSHAFLRERLPTGEPLYICVEYRGTNPGRLAVSFLGALV